jgi:hypothetical protein
LQVGQGIHDLIQTAGMKNSRVQMVRVAMIAEIQSENVEAGFVKSCAVGQDVVGIDAAFPAMQQNHQTARFGDAVPSVRLRRVKPLQPDAIATVENPHFFRRPQGC